MLGALCGFARDSLSLACILQRRISLRLKPEAGPRFEPFEPFERLERFDGLKPLDISSRVVK